MVFDVNYIIAQNQRKELLFLVLGLVMISVELFVWK
jgi:hypothetical protein